MVRVYGSAEPVLLSAKARAKGEELGKGSRWTPRGRRGRHAEKGHTAKARNHSQVAEAHQHSEGMPYKPLGGEIGMCLGVGRRRPIKRRWAGTTEPRPERGPLG